MKEYNTPEEVDELINNIYYAEDAVKYILNLPADHKDSELRTSALMEAYSDLAAACEDWLRAYRYYLEAENYLCANQEEMIEHILRKH